MKEKPLALSFLTEKQVRQAAADYGTPLYVYDEKSLIRSAQKVLAFPNLFGLTARYSMKALPNSNVLKLFDSLGLHFDASSGFEAERALKIGIAAGKIQITAQELPKNLKELKAKGVLYVACSLHQLESYGKLFPGDFVGVRINPGIGSGHSNRTNVGGPSASFGIWHEYIPRVHEIARKYKLKINKLHTHIGSGSDPEVWKKVAHLSLETAKKFPEVETLNLGGGFKVGRMPAEKTADMTSCGKAVLEGFKKFFKDTGRKLKLEIEPGTYLVALSGNVICEIMDRVDTGENGHTFLKVNSGMTEVTRPSLYGAQHPLIVVPARKRTLKKQETVMVVGHCCESGDILTPGENDPEKLCPRLLKEAAIGDFLVIEGTGAYCSGMSTKNYNSFPEAMELLLMKNGQFRILRKRQTIDQMIQNEVRGS